MSMELVPLVQLSDPGAFDYAPFWRQLLSECSSAAGSLQDSLAEQGQEVASLMEEQAEGLEVGCSLWHSIIVIGTLLKM